MRIARVSTVPYMVASQLAKQIEVTIRSGASVTVITSEGAKLDQLKSQLPSLKVISVEIARPISIVKDIKALLRLFLIFRREKFDIVHSATPKAGLLSAIAARLAGVPVRLHTFTGQPWVHLSGPVRWLARWSDILIGKLNTRCYADSASQRQFLVGQGVIPAHKLFVIGAGSLAGVDLTRFDAVRFSAQERLALKNKLKIPHHAPVLLFVGRITVDKGVRELIAAFRELKTRGSPAHLIFAGPLDLEVGAAGGISHRDIEVAPDTHAIGYTKIPEAYMAIADILCLPSYREGFGTVVIEAAAMGVPTIGTDIYGLSDAVVNGETGILVPPQNSTALTMALADLLVDEKKRKQMGDAAKRRAEHLFNANEVNGKVVEEYFHLLKGGKREQKKDGENTLY